MILKFQLVKMKFVLGDNRVNSLDSRELGCFKIENVLSKKGIILFPFNHMKGMN
jgi:signal peptidase I